jgi:hypothetical protein
MHVSRKTSWLLDMAALSVIGLAVAPTALAQSYTAVDLNPTNLSGISGSLGMGISGSQQVGYSSDSPGSALFWNGTAGGAVSLAPAGFASSYAFQTNGTQQIGYGSVLGKNNAVLWSGSAASYIDLHPGGLYTDSAGFGISGNREAGIGEYPDPNSPYAGVYIAHAMTWTDSAASYLDINPTNISGITTSYAYSIYDNTEVGTISGSGTGNSVHASLWSGTAESAVDLNPAGFATSTASSVYGNQQAGRGVMNGISTEHALLWSGTAASAIDLNPSVVVNGQTVAFTASAAYSIAGNQEVGMPWERPPATTSTRLSGRAVPQTMLT